MDATSAPSGSKSLKSLPDYSHKSQELNLFAEGLKEGKLLHPGAEVLPVCGDQESNAFDVENLEQWDSARRWKLAMFGVLVVISGTILVLMSVSISESGPVKKATTKGYTLHVASMMVTTLLGVFGILLYRLLPETPMWILKWIHGGTYLLVFFAMIFASCEVLFDHPLESDVVHLRTLHSWCAVLLGVVLSVEFFSGLVFLFVPSANKKSHSLLQEFHKVLGLSLQVVACATTVTGIAEFVNHVSLICDQNCSTRISLVRMYGLLTVLFFMFFFVLVLSERFKRKARPQWTSIYTNPHNVEDSASQTIVSKRSLFKMRRKKRHEKNAIRIPGLSRESSAVAGESVKAAEPQIRTQRDNVVK